MHVCNGVHGCGSMGAVCIGSKVVKGPSCVGVIFGLLATCHLEFEEASCLPEES